jgi:hypothetical protein
VNDPVVDHATDVNGQAANHVDDVNDQAVGNNHKVNDPMVGKTSDGNLSRLSDVVGWFKANTTNYYIKGVKAGRYPVFDKRLWQRNYYEHIIRTEAAYTLIDEYIRTNPERWAEDKLR